MLFTVTIDQFSGPLDLMLHLIKEKELDLFDLDIFVLTEQYINYLTAMEELRLEVASEYLIELATLIEYKSRKLLPKDVSELESEYEEDQRDLLVKRLLEYQRFKEVISPLQARYEARLLQLSKPTSEYSPDLLNNNLNAFESSPYELTKALEKCFQRAVLKQNYKTKFTSKELSVDEMLTRIKHRYAQVHNAFSFNEILADCQSLSEAIIAFLAILDLIRLNLMNFSMNEAEIWLRWAK